jgi:ABC-type glycerol-3-phosphate transport system substrate-binding protein
MVGCFDGCNTSGSDGYETKPPQDLVLEKPVINEPVTISVLTSRHSGYTTEADQLWFFKYMEYWFEQQCYDVTFDVQQTTEAGTQASLLLNTNNLPDLMFGINISNTNIVKYGIEDTLLLDWTPYINDVLMPNLKDRMEADTQMTSQMKAPDNGIYGLPYINPSLTASGCYGVSERFYFRQSWLDKAGVTNPTNKDELLNVLRAFKTKITDVTPEKDDVPLVSSSAFLEKYLWTCLGFYGTEPGKFGTNIMIKNEELVLPAYTESYKEFVTIMKTMYDEGLIAQDFFSYSDASCGALISAEKSGALCWWTLEHVGDKFADIVCANPIPLGDVTKVEDIHVSNLNPVNYNRMWASSKYEEPRILAMLLDFVSSNEGAMIYRYGISKEAGGDPLGLVEGWYFDEKGQVTNDKVVDGTRSSMSDYGRYFLFPNDAAGLRPVIYAEGFSGTKEYTDSVTGEKYTVANNQPMSKDNNDGHWRLITIEKWSDRATCIRIPNMFLGSADMEEFTDLKTAINNWINSETVKFITGIRPMSEIETFWDELEGMEVERYMELINKGYESWMNATFGE